MFGRSAYYGNNKKSLKLGEKSKVKKSRHSLISVLNEICVTFVQSYRICNISIKRCMIAKQ